MAAPSILRQINREIKLTMKDILLFSDEYPPEGGGSGIVAMQLSKDLGKLGRNVDLLVGSSNREQKEVRDNIHECWRFTLIWPLLYAFKLMKLRAWRYKHFILNDNVSAYLAGLLFSQAMLQRSTILVHGDDGKYFFENESKRHTIFRYRFFYKRALKYCANITAASKYARINFLKYTHNHLQPATRNQQPATSKVTYAYMGINTENFSLSLKSREEINVPSDAIFIFSASRLTEDKGLLKMLDYFQKVRHNFTNIVWLIAGTGPLYTQLEQRITTLNLQGCVRLLGKLPRENLSNYYSNADIFWLLSDTHCETFGLVYIEAAYFGCPSIGLSNAGVPEAISEGVSGYFYDHETDLASLIKKTIALDRIECKKHAEKFQSIFFAKHIISIQDKTSKIFLSH